MGKNASHQLEDSNDNNPHKKMHKIVFIIVVACLTVQVTEGSFIVPYILVHFGYPDLTIHEICDEMYFVVYKDDHRTCNFPYPLFSEVEPWKYKDMSSVIGASTPPRPHYEGYHFREFVTLWKERQKRLKKKAAEAAAVEKKDNKNPDQETTHKKIINDGSASNVPLHLRTPGPPKDDMTLSNIAMTQKKPDIYMGVAK